jgi:Trm5-related predicted tRNA methylase
MILINPACPELISFIMKWDNHQAEKSRMNLQIKRATQDRKKVTYGNYLGKLMLTY